MDHFKFFLGSFFESKFLNAKLCDLCCLVPYVPLAMRAIVP